MDHVYQTYIKPGKNVYWQDGGANVVGFFGGCELPLKCTVPGDWETIWGDVENYVNNPPQSYNMKFVSQYGSFNSPLGAYTDGSFASPSLSAGAFAWPQPYTGANCWKNTPPNCFVSNPPSQDYWCDSTGIVCPNSSAYLDRFYTDGWNSGKITIGLLYAGFDDSNTYLSPGWGEDRVISQRCGQTLLDTANEVTKGGHWPTTSQIPYMQLVTWNDYEEGTEMESGVDNCYWTVALTLPPGSSTMNWALGTQNDPNGEAVASTIHHYVVWTTGRGGTNLTNRKQLWHGATSFNLSSLGLPPGTTYDVYLEMIGQPSMQNEMSNKVTYTQQ